MANTGVSTGLINGLYQTVCRMHSNNTRRWGQTARRGVSSKSYKNSTGMDGNDTLDQYAGINIRISKRKLHYKVQLECTNE